MYFFHLTEEDEFSADTEGLDLPDLAAVQKAAVEGTSGLIADAVKRGRRDYRGRFEIEDEAGARVLILRFACPIRIEAIPALSDR